MAKATYLCSANLVSNSAGRIGYPSESLVGVGRTSGQNCSVPVKLLPWHLVTLVAASEPLNKAVSDVKFGPIVLLFTIYSCSNLTMLVG